MGRQHSSNNWVLWLVVITLIAAAGAAGWFLRPSESPDVSTLGLDATEDEVTTSQQASSLPISIKQRSGVVEVPENIAAEELAVVSLGETATVTAAGEFTAAVYDDGVTVVGAMVPNADYGLLAVVIGDEEPELTFMSTAIAMVFLAPQLSSTDSSQAREIRSRISANPAISALASELERTFAEGIPPLDDPAVSAAYTAALESVITSGSE